jgi:hypothetical protein
MGFLAVGGLEPYPTDPLLDVPLPPRTPYFLTPSHHYQQLQDMRHQRLSSG